MCTFNTAAPHFFSGSIKLQVTKFNERFNGFSFVLFFFAIFIVFAVKVISASLAFQAASLSHLNVLENIQLILEHAPIMVQWDPVEVSAS